MSQVAIDRKARQVSEVVELGDLDGGDSVQVDTWTPQPGPNQTPPIVTHNDGAAVPGIRTVPNEPHFFEVVFTEPSAVIVGSVYLLAFVGIIGSIIGGVVYGKLKQVDQAKGTIENASGNQPSA